MPPPLLSRFQGSAWKGCNLLVHLSMINGWLKQNACFGRFSRNGTLVYFLSFSFFFRDPHFLPNPSLLPQRIQARITSSPAIHSMMTIVYLLFQVTLILVNLDIPTLKALILSGCLQIPHQKGLLAMLATRC